MVERESAHKVLAAVAAHRLLVAQQHLLQLAAMVAQELPLQFPAAASLMPVVAVDARRLLRQIRRERAAQEGAVMLPLLVAHQQALLARPTQVAAAVVVETTQLPAPATAAPAVPALSSCPTAWQSARRSFSNLRPHGLPRLARLPLITSL